MIDLTGKTVLITGADGGVGRGIAQEFAHAGAALAVHSISNSESARAFVDQLRDSGVEVAHVWGDIRSAIDCAEIVATVIRVLGSLDVLVNNAGIQPLVSLAEMTHEQWNEVVAVNLTGTFLMTQAAAREMAKVGAGSVIHIASVEASMPAVNHAHYDASKAGVKMHARNAALELGKHGIRVNSVSPGLVDRDGKLASDWPAGYSSWTGAAPLGRTATPQDIGQACVFLASELASFISGHDLVVDGGMSAVAAWGRES